MAKRKLSLQQQRRIAGKHQPESDLGSDTGTSGLVVRRFRNHADVLALEGELQGQVFRCHIRANIQDIVTGDRVRWQRDEESAVVTVVLPRTSLMSRPDAKGNLRPVAANVSQIAVVIATRPQPHQNLVDRYLVAAEYLGIKPLIIVNKIDLAAADAGEIAKLVTLYGSLHYQVIQVSATEGTGVAQLLAVLNGESTVFVGQSGVGKSSLINLIHPPAEAAVGELSDIAKGRHTTTTATLYPLTTGGYLIDSPGIREFGLWHLESGDIAMGFAEFRPFLGQCRFRDCRHFNEKDCAVVEASQQGNIAAERLVSYQQIVNDLNQG